MSSKDDTMIYENEIGLISYHMNACHSCVHVNGTCKTSISDMVHKGNFMLCPNFKPVSVDELVDRFYDDDIKLTEEDIRKYMTER